MAQKRKYHFCKTKVWNPLRKSVKTNPWAIAAVIVALLQWQCPRTPAKTDYPSWEPLPIMPIIVRQYNTSQIPQDGNQVFIVTLKMLP
jgi:hypothetical protein